MKKVFYYLLFLFALCSCEKEENEKSGNAQIASFSISNPDFPELQNYKFTIDQIGGQLFNVIPIPHNILVGKIFLDITTIEHVSSILVIVNNEEIIWKKDCIIDISNEISILVTSENGIHKKGYKLSIIKQQP